MTNTEKQNNQAVCIRINISETLIIKQSGFFFNFAQNLKIQTIMTHLQEGDKAPYFEGISQEEKTIKLTDFQGKKLILYFYPKDNTSGCTAESCNLNDNYAELTEKGFEVLGVSPDSVASHLKFIAKHNFAFNLIADTEKYLCN